MGVIANEAHAWVSVYAATTGALQLDRVPATISAASPRQFQQYGGLVQYIVHIDPPPDFNTVRDGDTLTINAWLGHSIDPTRQYLIQQATPMSWGVDAFHEMLIRDRQAQGG